MIDMKNKVNYRPILRNYLLSLAAALLFGQASAQTSPADTNSVKKLVSAAEKYSATLAPEKIYLHFDRPYYAVGDTAWFKAYVMAADGRSHSAKSVKLYVELLSDQDKVVQRLAIPLFDGLAQGFIPFDEKTAPEGNYTIRAYTNWAQNFGQDAFYHKQIDLAKLGARTWLVSEQHQAGTGADSDKILLAMRFNDAKGSPMVLNPLSIKVMEGKKNILSNNLTTGVDGTLSGKILLPAKADRRNLSIYVEDAKDKSKHLSFPFYPSAMNNSDIDLQFMPEGGRLVAGIYNKIGFKAIGEDGLGRPVKGIIIDNTGEDAGTFEALHNGMGSFALVPQAGKTYKAKVSIRGKERFYTLPPIKTQGPGLRVDGVTNANEIFVYVAAPVANSNNYTLVARGLGGLYFASGFTLNAEGYFNTRINKNKFPTGIANLAILGPDNKAIAQRSIFIDRHDALEIAARPAQLAFAPGDSVSVALQAHDLVGDAVQGSFSVSVTDDTQVKDGLAADNIQSHMLLGSELKGYIENPAWYFEKGDEKTKAKALDNLLLTQGWQGFDLDILDKPLPTPLFHPEPDINVNGKLTNLFNKPAKNLKVILMMKSKLDNAVMDTLSDENGRFSFQKMPLIDSVTYLVKLHNGRDKTAAAKIEVEDFTPTNATYTPYTRNMPWNVNADTTLINFMNKAQQRQDPIAFIAPAGKVLKQVNIKDQRVVKYVNGEFATELFNIDEKQLIAAKKMSLQDLLYQRFPGLKRSNMYAPTISSRTAMAADEQYVYGGLLINDIIADGQSVADPVAIVEDITAGGNGVISGADVKPGEMNVTSKPSKKEMFGRINEFLLTVGAEDVTSVSLFRGVTMMIVIETRSKKGPYTRTSLGTYAYRPLPMQLPKQFYRPKYDAKIPTADLRPTIHWEPNLLSDDKGNGQFSFYAADKPGTYTVTIEGTDMRGHYGVTTQKITIGTKGNQ